MRRVLALSLLAAPLLLGATPTPTTTPVAAGTGAPGPVVLLVVDGMINPASADYIRGGIAAAAEQGAAAVVVQLDTPGGLLESTKVIVKDMLGAPVPVLVMETLWLAGLDPVDAKKYRADGATVSTAVFTPSVTGITTGEPPAPGAETVTLAL